MPDGHQWLGSTACSWTSMRVNLGTVSRSLKPCGWSTARAALTLALAVVMASPRAIAQVAFTTLADFNGTNGQGSRASFVQGLDGNFYSTSGGGGANQSGTVYKFTPSGTVTTVYSFCGQPDCADGSDPSAGLTLGSDGDFYGTTSAGGTGRQGTVFKVTPAGMLTTLYSFCSQPNCADGTTPLGGLVLGIDENFYGTTAYGGSSNWGTVFKVTPDGALTTLYTFTGGNDGAYPEANLVQGTDGAFYGTTSSGSGGGSIFSITPEGAFTVLFDFDGLAGSQVSTPLVQAGNGNFYGTSYGGGDYYAGTVFEITPWGALTILWMFTGVEGSYPSGLVEGTDGNFYGTTQGGGVFSIQCGSISGCGTVFRISPKGSLTTLHKFCEKSGCPDGNYPDAGLLQATDGNFYSTTLEGGSGSGTIFGLSVQLGPFVEAQPMIGTVGIPVRILGTNLTGATSVTFNGVLARFKVVSRSLIATTVPAGATNGDVQVVTPGGTLKSNVPFRVIQ